ncbi:DNA helicase, partial [Paenibacillus larvae]
MSVHGEQLLSKIVDTNDVLALKKYGIERYHFATEPEWAAYDFIVRYASKNGGNAPSYATYVSACP